MSAHIFVRFLFQYHVLITAAAHIITPAIFYSHWSHHVQALPLPYRNKKRQT
ncbi:hypothetical protein C2W63_03618 [Bacillus velezensis]|nr:hypothetical protein C2W63_03618 [Bacillus velezensis]